MQDDMDRIYYAGESALTGTRIAHALLEYAQALAVADTSATVEIPVLADDGSITTAMYLVGPASQLVSETEETAFDELVDPAALQRLEEATLVARRDGARAAVSGEQVPDESPWPGLHES
jgi:hypothetical protein